VLWVGPDGQVYRQETETTLDLEQLHRIEGDPGVGSSQQVPPSLVGTANPRVRVLERPPSPSLDPPAYWLMEPLDPATSLRGC
jgi:hypothetical protein